MIIVSASLCNLEVHHTDENAASLNDYLEEENYIEQPEGFSELGQKNYGLLIGEVCIAWNKHQSIGMKSLIIPWWKTVLSLTKVTNVLHKENIKWLCHFIYLCGWHAYHCEWW